MSTTTPTISSTDLTRFASTAVHTYRRIIEAGRPIDRKTANAEMDGLCKAADALGLAMTPFHLWSTVQEAVVAAGLRPRSTAMDNQPMRDWDAAVTADVARVMGWA